MKCDIEEGYILAEIDEEIRTQDVDFDQDNHGIKSDVMKCFPRGDRLPLNKIINFASEELGESSD